MKIRADNGEFIVPREQEYYVLFEYPDKVFAIRVCADGETEVFIPRNIEKTDLGFKILDKGKEL